jgi:predicted nucleotide-binding protein
LERWQNAAITLIGETDRSLLEDVSRLSVMEDQGKIFGALTSTMSVLVALTSEDAPPPPASAPATAPGPNDPEVLSTSVFIVHGHDEAMKQAVARFISALDLIPIVLHEQPNRGRTIIEKFEQNAGQVGFAVVLMSGDDIGYASAQPEVTRARARQNVVMELGYFTGTLGRSRICVLVSSDVEIPSDYMGVIYTPFDAAGAWKLTLANELRSSGYQISIDRLLR